jgi:hypothetical protein
MISQDKWRELLEHFDHNYPAIAGALMAMSNDETADFLLTVRYSWHEESVR